MKLKLDENLAHGHRERLRAAGHDVDTVVSEGLGGASDDQVMAAAIDAGRALVTLDLADPWRLPPAESSGIAVLRVRGRPGRRDIEPLVDRLNATLETLVSSRVDGASFWQTTIDENNNLIVANVDSADSDLANALLSAVPQGVLTIAHNDTALDLEQSRFNGAPPYEAGKRVDAGRCTSGLVWTKGTSILGSTAGHCAYNGEAINLSGVFYGFGYNSQYSKPGLIDSDIIFIRGYNPKHYTPPYIYVTDDGFNRIVRAGSRDADLYDGTVVCMSGSATGTPTCGHVYNNFVNGPDGKPDGRRYQGLVCATYSSVTGDSGAPIYEPGKGNRARGLGGHVASARDIKTDARLGGCYSAEGNIEGDAGVHLEIQSGG